MTDLCVVHQYRISSPQTVSFGFANTFSSFNQLATLLETTTFLNHFSPVSLLIMENSHTPDVFPPPGTKTPPVGIAMNRHNQLNGQRANGTERAGSEPIDPAALSKALKEMDDAGRVRERTPGASPSRKRQRVYGDRSVHSLSVWHTCLGTSA